MAIVGHAGQGVQIFPSIAARLGEGSGPRKRAPGRSSAGCVEHIRWPSLLDVLDAVFDYSCTTSNYYQKVSEDRQPCRGSVLRALIDEMGDTESRRRTVLLVSRIGVPSLVA